MEERLDILVVESDAPSGEPLRRLLLYQEAVGTVEVEATLEGARIVLDRRDDVNAIFIDIYSFKKPQEAADWIFTIREFRPSIVFALYSGHEELRLLPDLDSTTRERLSHYYRLAKDVPLHSWHSQLTTVLLQCANYLVTTQNREHLLVLRERVAHLDAENFPDSVIAELDRYIEEREQALRQKQSILSPAEQSFAPFVFVKAENFEKIVVQTLNNAAKSLSRSSKVHFAVLCVGSIIVLSSFFAALITGSWAMVSFGGIGLGGIIGALMTNPMRAIGSEARRIVQIQVAYLGFLSQIQFGSDLVRSMDPGQVLEKIGQECERIIKSLAQI
jgi:hypothetical protein